MKTKLLLLSYAFPPSIGGIETVSQILAEDLPELGYEVTVITHIGQDKDDDDVCFRTVRRPGSRQLTQWTRWADVVLQNNTSLRLAWPLYTVFRRKPFLLVHQTPISRPSGKHIWRDNLKLGLLKRPVSLTVSAYMAKTMNVPAVVIPNPYAEDIFRVIPDVNRTRDLLFVGRLVGAKGLDVLLRALAVLRDRGEMHQLSIIGLGPEEAPLRTLATDLGLQDQINFVGPATGEALARQMNRHKVLVVPSRAHPPEAFGIVALEGLACGCVVVGSDHGGLPEAIGPCGLLFENENPASLANNISLVFNNAERAERLRAQVPEHLSNYRRSVIVKRYHQRIQIAIATLRT